MGGKINDEELASAMKELDTSADGKVSFDEFQAYWDSNYATGGCVWRLLSAAAAVCPLSSLSCARLSSAACTAQWSAGWHHGGLRETRAGHSR